MRRNSIIIAVACLLTACAANPQKELEHVAKDWCLTIRASQIIPVYPLTEDLQPGDVFLVSTRIEEQVAAYKAKGFLSLENLVVRLGPTGYEAFYRGRFGAAGNPQPPRNWEETESSSTPAKKDNWQAAPRAAFPSYTVSVKRNQGLNLALPIQGIPVGLSLMNATAATGTVQIADAFTYGIDMRSLQQQVQEWAVKNHAYLRQFATSEGEDNIRYLRVMTRVYLARKVNISLLNQQARGAAADVGASKPVSLPQLATENTEENLKTINNALASGLDQTPGGSLKLSAVSGRSVSMVETFPHPLVIGYLGFDLPILENGMLGSPVATQANLTGEQSPPPTPWGEDSNTERIKKWINADSENKAKLRNWLQEKGYESYGVTNILRALQFAQLRQDIVVHFNIP